MMNTNLASIRPPVALTGNFCKCSSRRLSRVISVIEHRDPERTYAWKETPISVKKTSRFFPVRLLLALSRTFSSNSQQATHGSVFTRAKERSSLRGLKSLRFCFVSCSVNADIVTKESMLSKRVIKITDFNISPSMILCKTAFTCPSRRLRVWLLNTTISRLIVTEVLASAMSAVLTYCCHK